ncbi:MAG: FlgD immunoglobulin-like domain containing protein [Candidatus Neomarinimicrobiota bacterium]|nr:FlgD immunoglobulin-like domain containing protein [Candidatus Neomarinimicrobiota bacterium]
MRRLILCFIVPGQLVLADDVTLWISSADDNSVGVSMIAEEEIYGFQMMFSVEEGPENIFAPVDSAFYNDAGESVSSTVIYPISGTVLDFGYTCFINEEGLLVAFSFDNLGIAPGDTVVLVELPWLVSGATPDQVSIVDPLFVGLNENGEPISLEVEYGLIEYQDGWPYETTTQVISSPTIVSFESGNKVLFGDYNGYFRIVNPDGSDVCWFNTGNQIWGSPAVSDIDNNGDLEIIITSKSQHLYVLDDECNLELDFDAEQYLMGTPAIGNLDDDPEKEIVFGGYTNPGTLFAINHDGSSVENFPLELGEKIQRGVALADFNGNGKDDIVCGTDDEHIYLIYDDGTIADGFPFTAASDFRTAPIVIDVNGSKIIFAGSRDNTFYAINADGSLRFEVQTGDDIPSSAGIVETNSGPAVFFGSEDGFLYGVDMDGNPLTGWPKDTGIDVIGSPVFADLDSDGLPEVIATNGGVDFLVFRLDGSPFDEIPIEFELPFVSSPSVADLDMDGDLELLAGTSESVVAVDIKDPGATEGYWNVYRGNLERNGFYQSSGGGMEISHIADWNLVGLPLNVDDATVTTVFPESIEGTLFSFNVSYVQEDALVPGTGYCLRFESEGTTVLTGTSINSLTLDLAEGWNLISGISSTVDVNGIGDTGEIIIPGTIYGYNGSYVQAETIEPGNGYWMRAGETGSITISNTLSRREESRNLLADAPIGNTLRFDNRMDLYFGVELSKTNILSYSLPPKIPGGFDVRFAGDIKAIDNFGVIELTHSSPIITLSYDATIIGENWVLINKEKNEEYTLTGRGELQIPAAIHFLELRRSSSSAIPETFALHQAYPNPFNPVTTIRFDLPEDSDIRLTIYNLVGKEIRNLVSGEMPSGFNYIIWDGANNTGQAVSAGVYLFQIQADGFVQTKKMILLK